MSGEARKDKAAKVAAAHNLWVPAINNHGGFGRWGFLEISDPWDAKNTIRAALDCASHNCAFGGAVEAVSRSQTGTSENETPPDQRVICDPPILHV